jgi:hypothetical protein
MVKNVNTVTRNAAGVSFNGQEYDTGIAGITFNGRVMRSYNAIIEALNVLYNSICRFIFLNYIFNTIFKLELPVTAK